MVPVSGAEYLADYTPSWIATVALLYGGKIPQHRCPYTYAHSQHPFRNLNPSPGRIQ